MRGVTTVRLIDAPVFERHANNERPLGGKSWANWRGKPIKILLPPEEPNSTWSCDTPVVWRIAPEAAEALRCPRNTYVCVHQVEID